MDLRSLVKSIWLAPNLERESRKDREGSPFPLGGPKKQGDEILLGLFLLPSLGLLWPPLLSNSQGLEEY